MLVRPATPADYEHFVRLFPELLVDDPLPSPSRWAELMAPNTLLFEEEGHVVAYVLLQVVNDLGYVRHVVVDPAQRGRGLGRAVMDVVAAHFRAAGCSRWCLNVKPDNLPALRLYQSVGMKQAYLSNALRMDWSAVAQLPPPDREMTARLLEPAEDAAVEAAFGMPGGTLTTARRQPGKVVLRLVDVSAPDDARAGAASFDPHFPGAFPFRVGQPSWARALLDAMKLHALPEHSFVQMVVEDDDALTRHLTNFGATIRLEIVHFTGAL